MNTMAEGKFATAITCMDGRVQDPVATWARQTFGVDYVDTITEPGPDAILADGPVDTIASIRKRVDISVRGHGSRAVAIVAHHDCAGNPVAKDRHLEHLASAVKRVASWKLPVRITSLYVDEQWQVEVVEDIESSC
jgi:carbonic anhydrase